MVTNSLSKYADRTAAYFVESPVHDGGELGPIWIGSLAKRLARLLYEHEIINPVRVMRYPVFSDITDFQFKNIVSQESQLLEENDEDFMEGAIKHCGVNTLVEIK